MLALAETLEPHWRVRPRRQRVCGWRILRAGLLRAACGASLREVAHRLGRAIATAQSLARSHAALALGDTEYADRAVDLLLEVARRDLPNRPSPRAEVLATLRPA